MFHTIVQFFTHASPHNGGRKKSHKPPPITTHFQLYTKRHRALRSSSSRTSAQSPLPSSNGSSGPSASASFDNATKVPDQLFEPMDDGSPKPEPQTFIEMELARLRLRSRWGEPPASASTYSAPDANQWASHSSHDSHASASFSGPSDGSSHPRSRSQIVQDWNKMQREAASLREDKRLYAQIRAEEPVNQRWEEYNRKWAKTLADVDDRPPLAFCEIPWPVGTFCSKPSDILPIDIHLFLLGPVQDRVPGNAIQRLEAEIQRWNPDRFCVEIVPLVVEQHQELVEDAAADVLSSLIIARNDFAEALRVQTA